MLGRRGTPRPVRELGCVVIVGVALAALNAVPAFAGDWGRAICQNPDGTAAPIAGLAFTAQNAGSNQGAYGGDDCPGGLPSSSVFPAGVWAGISENLGIPTAATWTYTAPAGSTIAGGSITGVDITQTTFGVSMNDFDSWISSPGDDPDSADLIADCATPAPQVDGGLPGSDPCAINPDEQVIGGGPDSLGGPPTPAAPLVADINQTGGTQLFMTAGCGTGNTDPCYTPDVPYTELGFNARFEWADILLSDDTTPTGTGFGGSLLASGSVHGTAQLTFTANDPQGPGVYQVTVKIDGNTIYQGTPNNNGGECSPVGTDPATGALIFDYQQPCPPSVDLDIPIDTTKLTDGDHQVQVTVEDAAGNQSTVLDQTFTTTNLTSAAATTGENLPPATTTTTTTTTPSAPATAASDTYSFRLDATTATLTRAAVVHRHYDHSRLTLSGTIMSSSGAPVANAPVAVQSAPLDGVAFATVAQAASDAAGHFTVLIPRGDSRVLKLVGADGSVSVKELVTPNVSLQISSLPTAQLLFTGRVAIDRDGGPAPVIQFEVYDPSSTPNKWLLFASVPAGKAGRFRYLYKPSSLTIGYTYKVRAITNPTALWDGAASPTRDAKVRR